MTPLTKHLGDVIDSTSLQQSPGLSHEPRSKRGGAEIGRALDSALGGTKSAGGELDGAAAIAANMGGGMKSRTEEICVGIGACSAAAA